MHEGVWPASATADSLLSGNQTILKYSKEALLHKKNSNTPLADEISAATWYEKAPMKQ